MAKKAEVLLLKPLPPKGNAGDVIDVKIHYAQHVLIPQGVAVFNTQQVKNQRNAQMKQIAKNKSDILASVKHMVEQVEKDNGITFTKQITETGTLYDSISHKTLAQYVHDTFKIKLSSEHFDLAQKIEAIGDYEASFTYEDISATFPIHVVAAK